MSSLQTLDAKYRVIFCDIWGCIHDGIQVFPGAAERLRRWRAGGQKIILITNAPRTAQAVAEQLKQLGLHSTLWDGIATSGDAGIETLRRAKKSVGFIGTNSDKLNLEGRQIQIAAGDDFDELACAGLDETRRTVAEYDEEIRPLAARDVLMHCLNPDRLVLRGSVSEPCAGAIADRYLEFGGRVEWYGKPYSAIYRHAMRLAGDPPVRNVLAVGDGLVTDILGAARMGFDCVYVTGGIAQGESIPHDFAEKYSLGNWKPVAVVGSLS